MVEREKTDPVYEARVKALRGYLVPKEAKGYNGEKRSTHHLACVPVGGRVVVASPHLPNLRRCVQRYGKRHDKIFQVTVDALTGRALVTRVK